MKVIPAFLATIVVLSLVSCSDDNSTGPEAEPKSMKATIEGKAWSATVVAATKGAGQTVIVGQGTDNSMIKLSLGTINAPGSYTIEIEPAARYDAGTTSFIAQSGTLKITSYDDAHVAGAFSFEGESLISQQKVSVTNGAFNASF